MTLLSLLSCLSSNCQTAPINASCCHNRGRSNLAIRVKIIVHEIINKERRLTTARRKGKVQCISSKVRAGEVDSICVMGGQYRTY